MIKKIAIIVVALALFFAVGFYFYAAQLIGKIATTAVETVGPDILKADVKLEDVSVHPFSGKASVKGLFVGNPSGFTSPKAFSLGQMDFEVDIASLKTKTIVIRKILVSAPEVVYEQTLLSGSNISALQQNIAAYIGPSTVEPVVAEEPSVPSDLKFEVKSFVFEKGRIEGHMTGKSFSLDLPALELKNLGTPEGGLSPEAMANTVVSELLKNVTTAVANRSKSFLPTDGQDLKTSGENAKKAVQDLRGFFKK
jgi:uncharacterized protein involved in outer membrane biogenesis